MDVRRDMTIRAEFTTDEVVAALKAVYNEVIDVQALPVRGATLDLDGAKLQVIYVRKGRAASQDFLPG
jgi:hypothetical protein